MRHYLTTVAISLSVFFSCANQNEETISVKSAAPVKSFEGDAGNACFDIQMEVWMEKFQHFQQTGSDMYTADLKARAASLQAFRDCDNRKSKAVVSNEARKN